MIETIMQQAKDLGKKLSESDEFKEVQEKEAAMVQDKEALDLLKEFQTLQEENQRKQMQGGQIAPEDIKSFEAMEEKLMANPLIKDFNGAQNTFQALLDKVNETINNSMFAGRMAAESSCSSTDGSCECGSCKCGSCS